MKILKKELMSMTKTYDITIMIGGDKIIVRNTISSEGNDWTIMHGEETYKNLTDELNDKLFYLIQNEGFEQNKRQVNIILIDTNQPHDVCDTYLVETKLSDKELQEFIDNHKSDTDEYSTETVLEAINEHKDIDIVDGDIKNVELGF